MNQLHVVNDQQPAPVQHSGMIMPAGTIEDVLQQWRLYQELKNRIGTPDDFQVIVNKKTGEKRKHPKKSFVRKVQRFFNVSCEIIQDEPLYNKEGKIIAWLARARAIHAATGAFQEADGSCGFDEKIDQHKTLHNIRAHAITRAKNRAILDLVGFGEVSAEEIVPNEFETPYPAQPVATPQRQGKPATEAQRRKIFSLAQKLGYSEERLKDLLRKETGKESTTDLTSLEASKLIEKLMAEEKAQDGKREVYDVNPDTGEVTFSDDEIEAAMGGGRNGNRS